MALSSPFNGASCRIRVVDGKVRRITNPDAQLEVFLNDHANNPVFPLRSPPCLNLFLPSIWPLLLPFLLLASFSVEGSLLSSLDLCTLKIKYNPPCMPLNLVRLLPPAEFF